jgi:histidine triad (HIT) family protein
MTNEDRIFCRISRHEAPASIVHEAEDVMAFMDLFPATRGHLLIIPREHYVNVYDLPEDLGATVFRVAVRLAQRAKRVLKPDGMNLLQANDPAGQQDVFHFHLHLIPRYHEDSVHLHWPPGKPSHAELDELARSLRGG